MSDEPSIAAADRERCVATWRNFLFSIRSGEQTLENILLQSTLSKTLGVRYPEGIGFMILYEPTAKIPNRECRQETVRRINEGTGTVVAVTVLDSSDFKTTILRTIIKSIAAMLNRGKDKSPRHLAGSVEEGVTFMLTALRKLGAQTVGKEHMVRVITRLREDHRQLVSEL